jgi:FemAB-related protein (PEP-CTERM system-associated)
MTAADTDTAVQVVPLTPTHAQAWDEYVLAHPDGTPFHLLAWSRSVHRAYGHRPHHLCVWKGGVLQGVLPLMSVRSLLAGRLLVSAPYATYGGILASSQPAAAELLGAAKALADAMRCRSLELRHRETRGLDLPVLDRYDTFRKRLPERHEHVMQQLPRKTRAAARNGLAALGDDCFHVGPQWLDAIYELYAITLRRLGSPNYRRSLFKTLAENYGDQCVCAVVRKGSEALAGVMSLVFRDEIVPYFSGSTARGQELGANNVMYMRLMEYAVSRGLKWFDFNRTRRDNHGPHAFKRYHGFEPAPLHYQVYLPRGGKLPDLTPSSGRFRAASRAWKKLPLWLTRWAGQRVTKWIP